MMLLANHYTDAVEFSKIIYKMQLIPLFGYHGSD